MKLTVGTSDNTVQTLRMDVVKIKSEVQELTDGNARLLTTAQSLTDKTRQCSEELDSLHSEISKRDPTDIRLTIEHLKQSLNSLKLESGRCSTSATRHGEDLNELQARYDGMIRTANKQVATLQETLKARKEDLQNTKEILDS